jgi:uncharacterized RDD family membrane protein YckC
MFCTSCGTSFEGQFCPSCGTRAGAASGGAAASGVPGGAAAASVALPAIDSVIGLHCGAVLIDAVPIIIVSLILGWVPIAGGMLVGLISIAYWLLRDINGASPGKMLLGLKVVRKDGSESGTQERILRNVTLIAGGVFALIPLAGLVLGPAIGLAMGIVELVFLLTQKERLGDRIAGTTVVRK